VFLLKRTSANDESHPLKHQYPACLSIEEEFHINIIRGLIEEWASVGPASD